MYMPEAIKETSKGIQSIPVSDLLFDKREIYFTDEVNPATMSTLLQQIRYLESVDPKEEITIFIHSPGGEVISGLAVYDYLRGMEAPVRTVCTGLAASMGSILFLAGDKREMLPHTKIMIHDPRSMGNFQRVADIKEGLDMLLETRDILNGIIAERSGMSKKEILQKTQKDTYFNAEEALKCGIATKILFKGTAS